MDQITFEEKQPLPKPSVYIFSTQSQTPRCNTCSSSLQQRQDITFFKQQSVPMCFPEEHLLTDKKEIQLRLPLFSSSPSFPFELFPTKQIDVTENQKSSNKCIKLSSSLFQKREQQLPSLQFTVMENLQNLGSRIEMRVTQQKGRGVFACEFIPKGTFLTAIPGSPILEKDLQPEQEYFQMKFLRKKNKLLVVYVPSLSEIKAKNPDLRLIGHLANHTSNTNALNVVFRSIDKSSVRAAFPRDQIIQNRFLGVLQASRNILPNEEIQWNYHYKEYPEEWQLE